MELLLRAGRHDERLVRPAGGRRAGIAPAPADAAAHPLPDAPRPRTRAATARGLAVSGAFATRNPQAVQNLVDGLVKAAALIQANPSKAAPHVGAALGKGIVDPDLIRKALVSPASVFEIDPRKIIEPSRAMQAYQVKLGSLEKELPFDGLFETQYYERAVKAGG